MRLMTLRRFTVCLAGCLFFLFALSQQALAAELSLHEAAKRGMLPSDDAGLIAGVRMYAASETLPTSKETGFSHEYYVYGSSNAVALQLLPRYAGGTVKLYGISYDEKNGFKEVRDKDPMFVRTLPGDTIFWLLLNIPDTSPRVRLCLDNGGKERCFTPFISGKDGSLVLEDGFVELAPLP